MKVGCSVDFESHRRVCEGVTKGWNRSPYGGDIKLAEKDLELKGIIEREGKVQLGVYEIRLSGNKKWLVRTQKA